MQKKKKEKSNKKMKIDHMAFFKDANMLNNCTLLLLRSRTAQHLAGRENAHTTCIQLKSVSPCCTLCATQFFS